MEDAEYFKLSRIEQIDATFPHPWYDGEITATLMQELIKLGFKFELEEDQVHYYANDGNIHYEISRNGDMRYCYIIPSKEITKTGRKNKRLPKGCKGCIFEDDFMLRPQTDPCKSCIISKTERK